MKYLMIVLLVISGHVSAGQDDRNKLARGMHDTCIQSADRLDADRSWMKTKDIELYLDTVDNYGTNAADLVMHAANISRCKSVQINMLLEQLDELKMQRDSRGATL